MNPEWTNDPIRSGGFPKLYNVIPNGASLHSRASTLFKYDYSGTPVNQDRGKNIRLIGYKFLVLPENIGFEDIELDSDKLLTVFDFNGTDTLHMEFRSYEIENDNRWIIDEADRRFQINMDDLSSTTDLNKWQFLQRYEDLYILTEKGSVWKITPKLTAHENPGENKCYKACDISVEVEKLGTEERLVGPSVGAVYYSAFQKPHETSFQKVPFFRLDGDVDRDGTFQNRKRFGNNEIENHKDNPTGTWWSGTDLDVDGGSSAVSTSSKRFVSQSKSMKEYPTTNDVSYICTYVDEQGVESEPGPAFHVNEYTITEKDTPTIDEFDSPYYGDPAIAGQAFLQGAIKTNQHAANNRCEQSCSVGAGGNFNGPCRSTDFSTGQNRDRCFDVVSDYADDLTNKTNPNALVRPNRIKNYNGVFNFGDRNSAFIEPGGTGRRIPPMMYPKQFHGGHKRILPKTDFQYKNYANEVQTETMGWHIVLDPKSLKPGFRAINIYKRQSAHNSKNPDQFNYFLFKIIEYNEAQMAVDFDPETQVLKSDGSTQIGGQPFPYTFRDDGEETDRGISVGEEIYKIGDGKPKAMTFYQQRLFLGNFRKFPSLIRGSDTGFLTFRKRNPTQADDSVEIRPETGLGEVIRHMVSRNDLILLGDEGTHSVKGSQGVGPGNVNVAKQDPYGAARLRPLEVEESVLFFQKGFQKLRDYLYSFSISNYKGNDLIFYARHLFKKHKVIDWTYQDGNPGIIWCVRDDGKLLAMTYLKELEMIGWSTHELAGGFKAQSVHSVFVTRPKFERYVLYIVTREGFIIQLDTIDNEEEQKSVDMFCFFNNDLRQVEAEGFYERIQKFINEDNYKDVYMEIDGKEAVYDPKMDGDDISTLRYEIQNRDDFTIPPQITSTVREFFDVSFTIAEFRRGVTRTNGRLTSNGVLFRGVARDSDIYDPTTLQPIQRAGVMNPEFRFIGHFQYGNPFHSNTEGMSLILPFNANLITHYQLLQVDGVDVMSPKIYINHRDQNSIGFRNNIFYAATSGLQVGRTYKLRFFLDQQGDFPPAILDRDKVVSDSYGVNVKIGFKMNCEINTFSILTGYHLAGPRVLGDGPDLGVLTNMKGLTFDYVSSFPVWSGVEDLGIGKREGLFLNKFPALQAGKKLTKRLPALTKSGWDENNMVVIKNVFGRPFKIAGINVDYE